MTTPEDARDRFRSLPERVAPEDAVESVDTSTLPLPDEGQDRDQLLRQAGA
jgi:hypothetical protein